MELEVVTVGTELLLGFTIDTNANDIARTLAGVGARVVRRTTVGDDARDIANAIGAALDRTRFVVVTGGLGPTSDDLTKPAVVRLLNAPLEIDAGLLSALEARFATFRPGPMPPSNRSQAQVPRGAVVLPNRRGTAPGLWMDTPRGTVVLLPGVPPEMRGLLAEEVAPRVARIAAQRHDDTPAVVASRTLRTTGLAESALADHLAPSEPQLPPVELAYLPTPLGVDLRLTVTGLPRPEAIEILRTRAALLRSALSQWCYGEDDADLAAVVLSSLAARGARLAVAESCTGGLLGARITAVPGASEVFVGGIVAYSDGAKTRDLGVPDTVLKRHGAVSEETARLMASGVRGRFGTDAAVAVTGIAGPTGGTPEKPVGTVCLAACLDSRVESRRTRFPGDREGIRQRTAQAALDLLRRMANEP
jgi:nicotinamide-nucleotide amidase